MSKGDYMFTLFIDTHFKDITICLFKDNKLFNEKKIRNVKSTSIETMPSIVDVINSSNITIHDINKIAIVKGPGSFTGVRIGVTIAKVLAYSLNIPIVSLTSLDLIGINLSNASYVAVKENNGVFITYYDKKCNTIDYYKNTQYDTFKTTHKVVEESKINYDNLINYINGLPFENPYNVNPLYVKTIEALNDKK